ncbi:ankyrin repeat domain-containing protein [Hydrogenovibrio halophilus]|uniref:ankyrin repeat domain-containing protein n=1 Tax=Hydrogenovibrio halophilus TaxID=373391 RepID=UPI000370E275|nr:ankyrin repeat domain-containing protein [Hydrogenovibrio halophilus]
MDLKQIANTPVFKKALVKEYQNGQLIRSGNQTRLNVSGLSMASAAGLMVLTLATVGLTFFILAPFYSVYMVRRYMELKRIEALEKSQSMFAPLKLQWHARIQYPSDGWFNRLFTTALVLSYAAIALLVWVQLYQVLNGQGLWIALAPYWPLMLFMFVSSTFLSVYLAPIKQEETAFQMGVWAFEQRFPGTLMDMAKDARQVIKKHGKKSREYQTFVEQATDSAVSSMQDAGTSDEDIKLYAGMLYQFLRSIKGKASTVSDRPVTAVTLGLVLLAAVLGWQQYSHYQATQTFSTLFENYFETDQAYAKAQTLVDQGANPNANLDAQKAKVPLVLEHGDLDTLKEWLALGVRMAPWPMYLLGTIDDEPRAMTMTKMLVRHGADLGAQWEKGQTLLHTAAAKGHVSLVAYLIDQGVALNPVWQAWSMHGTDRLTPLDIAYKNKTAAGDKIIDLLEEAGA